MYYTVKIGKEGRIALPIGLRKKLNWEIGTKITVTEEDNKITLRRADSMCKICGTTEKVVPEILVCQKCISMIKDLDLSDIQK